MVVLVMIADLVRVLRVASPRTVTSAGRDTEQGDRRYKQEHGKRGCLLPASYAARTLRLVHGTASHGQN
jgi:hypothetical protein